MVVETRYAAGSGVLLGAGAHWVLVTDPGDEDVVAALWEALSSTRPGERTVTEAVLAILEEAFDGDPPGLAMVDLSDGASTSVSRGAGHVRVSGPARTLSLDAGADHGAAPVRRLVGGVVAASRAEVRPIAHRVAPPVARVTTAPPAPTGLLIDGIPDAILAARGPEGPPPPRPRRTGSEPGSDTGSLGDTSEPDPGFMERIEEGGHTTIRPAGPPSPGHGEDDHDGATVHRPAGDHLRHSTHETVLAVSCPRGHLTPPTSPSCRVCHQPVAPQEPRRVPRPTLGGLRLPTGEVVPLDRGVVLGRRPAPAEGSHDWPHLVHLPADHSFVSRMHLRLELDGWHVVARDLASRGGTVLKVPGREPERMRANEAYVLEPGAALDLAEVYEVRFEVGPVGTR